MNLKNALLTTTAAKSENLTGSCNSDKVTGNMLTDLCFVPKERNVKPGKNKSSFVTAGR